MNLNQIVQGKKDCYAVGEELFLWKITGGVDFEPCLLEEKQSNIITHILVMEGEMRVCSGDEIFLLLRNSFSNFLDRTSVELLSVSSNIKAYVMVAKDDYMKEVFKSNPPLPFSYVLKIRICPVDMLAPEILRLYWFRMENIREVCSDENHVFRKEMLMCAISMLIMDMANVHAQHGGEGDSDEQAGRKKSIFIDFMHLLPVHAMREHSVGFYASELCITPQYLNRIVREFSGKTVYEWICFTLVGKITKQLENSDDSMQQIAEEFNFSDQAALAKFYKRETGYSLTEYRRKRTLK